VTPAVSRFLLDDIAHGSQITHEIAFGANTPLKSLISCQSSCLGGPKRGRLHLDLDAAFVVEQAAALRHKVKFNCRRACPFALHAHVFVGSAARR